MQTVITKSQLVSDFKKIGVEAGQVIMLHASVKSVGWIVGGPDMIIESLLDILTPAGTLMMVVGWEDGTYELQEWPPEKQQAYLEEAPPFDPKRSRAYRKWSILTEYLRTWPGAQRSRHPEGSFAAVGKQADWLTKDQPYDYGLGPGSPLEKLCEAEGKVLLLGTPFTTLTLLHLAECIADVPGKKVVRFRSPILDNGKRTWLEIEEYDTCNLIGNWQGEDYFLTIPQQALKSSIGRTGKIGAADSYLFDAKSLKQFAVHWLEETLSEKNR